MYTALALLFSIPPHRRGLCPPPLLSIPADRTRSALHFSFSASPLSRFGDATKKISSPAAPAYHLRCGLCASIKINIRTRVSSHRKYSAYPSREQRCPFVSADRSTAFFLPLLARNDAASNLLHPANISIAFSFDRRIFTMAHFLLNARKFPLGFFFFFFNFLPEDS